MATIDLTNVLASTFTVSSLDLEKNVSFWFSVSSLTAFPPSSWILQDHWMCFELLLIGMNHVYRAYVPVKLLQSCPTLCDPMDCSPPRSSVHGILQAGILGWFAVSSSRGSFQPRDRTCVSLHWQAGSFPLVPPRKPCLWSRTSRAHSARLLGSVRGGPRLLLYLLLSLCAKPVCHPAGEGRRVGKLRKGIHFCLVLSSHWNTFRVVYKQNNTYEVLSFLSNF